MHLGISPSSLFIEASFQGSRANILLQGPIEAPGVERTLFHWAQLLPRHQARVPLSFVLSLIITSSSNFPKWKGNTLVLSARFSRFSSGF